MHTNLANYHPVVRQIVELLIANNMWFEVFEHAPVRTSEEAAKVRNGYTLAQGSKAIIIKTKKTINQEIKKENNTSEKNSVILIRQSAEKDPSLRNKMFVMLVVPGDKKFDNKKVKKAIGAKDITFATEQEVSDITNGVRVGGVPPFGNLFGLEVYADPLVFDNEKIIFNAGDRSFSIAMKSDDYKQIVNPKIVEII